ncbi:PrsW family intramembrane metalloprotease [Halodesulfurarchaeum sp.]|uniref:PrsW family intramembrane metalloprotease n=1 Tax=Halodesulfurarchaeum sp. TaxID=1980530 RepID=UPI002FC29102
MRADRTLRIAIWETTTSLGNLDRRTGIAILVVLVLLGALGPALLVSSPAPGADLYRVGVSESSSYHDVVLSEPELQAIDPASASLNDGLDIVIAGPNVVAKDTKKSKAAAGVFREAVVSYNTYLMAQERDRTAAFPVTVTVSYVQQSALQIEDPTEGTETNADSPNGSAGGSGIASTSTIAESTGAPDRTPLDETPDSGGDDGGQSGTDEPDSPAQTTVVSDAAPNEDNGPGEPVEDERVEDDVISSSPLDGFLGTEQAGTPTSISPPFPLESLLLAFVFLLPFNFVIQAYGSSVIAERINRRGEPLLVSPATRGDIVVGKALPYFLGSLSITAIIAALLGGGIRSVVAIAPLAALFIAATFLAGLLSRSFKELTFATVTISVVLTGYAFLPAVFAEVHPIAAISPLTIVVNELQGTPVAWQTFFFATIPATFSAAVLFMLGTGMYREEDLFTQRPLPQKALDALAAPLHSLWRVGLWTGLFIPFVLVAELLAVATLYLLPVALSIPLLLGVIAIIEEVAKSIHVFAGFERGRFDPGLRSAVSIGAISGLGFFLAEKLLAITQLVGLPNLDLGQAAFAPELVGLTPALLLFAPLVLHTVTAVISALGARRSRRWYLLGLLVASGIHLAYNVVVVSSLG